MIPFMSSPCARLRAGRWSSGKLDTRCALHNDPEARRTPWCPGYRSFGWLLDGLSEGAGAVSTGFCVSVGWPVTSPGREDMPGSFEVP